ncbi:MAG: FMN-binding glutamate synthase family protein [Oligoflexales bacterium]|nr:FMN-binding glutamate synthase family protein [Oligoflexales bacterium]
MRIQFYFISVCSLLVVGVLGLLWTPFLALLLIILPLIGIGLCDILQKKQTIRRNFPIIGHGRYLMEMIRPEINQYFVESNSDGRPFSRDKRSLIYQRAKGQLDTQPFGTQADVYAVGYEWVNHSLAPVSPDLSTSRIKVGGKSCKKPYLASIFNISAMSYGALSKNAVLALNAGAKLGGFLHNTGEGGLSPYHRKPGGDLTWQIGTGYFGCRHKDGTFNVKDFAEKASLDQVKMIEIKLSQGAKPGHGGILPAKKVTPEIASIRGVDMGQDVISPPAHSAFSTPIGLLEFVAQLREASGGKPVGFKLCLGKRKEFLAICKAMLKTGILPDFITVDGGEGGTGAAPLEFTNSVGAPLEEGLMFVHNSLVGVGLREEIRVIASGKIVTGFHIMTKMALGADLCNSARGMMFALGCIQALRCNSNNCPTGVATQDPALVEGLVVSDKAVRVKNFHHETVKSFFEVLGATGLTKPSEIRRWHIVRRTGPSIIQNYSQIFPAVDNRALVDNNPPAHIAAPWAAAQAETFT